MSETGGDAHLSAIEGRGHRGIDPSAQSIARPTMELGAWASVCMVGDKMSGQGKQMPGMVARDPNSGPVPGAGNATSGGDANVPPQPPQPGRPITATADLDGFDAWLQAELARLYGSALAEPLPEDMIRLLHEAARKR